MFLSKMNEELNFNDIENFILKPVLEFNEKNDKELKKGINQVIIILQKNPNKLLDIFQKHPAHEERY